MPDTVIRRGRQVQRMPALVQPAGQPAPPRPAALVEDWARRTVEKVRSAVTGGLRFLPYLDNGTKETAEIRAAYPEMLREAVVKAGLLTKVLSVAQSDVSVTPEDKGDARQQEAAEFALWALRRLPGGTGQLAWNLLMSPLVSGWGLCEKVWPVDDAGNRQPVASGKWKGKIVWSDVKAKNPVNLSLDLDDFNNVVGVRNALDVGEVFDPADFVRVSYLSLYQNPFGMSDLRAAYRSFWLKDSTWKLRAVKLEKFSAGAYLKGTYADADQRAALEAALAEAASQTWLTVPAGVMVDAIDLSGGNAWDYQAAIQDCDREIMVALAGASLQALEGVTTDARGNSQVHQEVSQLFVWWLSAIFTGAVNEHLLPELYALNYADMPPGRLALGSTNDGDLLDSISLDVQLQGTGFPLGVDELAERYGRKPELDPAKILRPVAVAKGGGAAPAGGSGGQGGSAAGQTGPAASFGAALAARMNGQANGGAGP